MLRRATLATGHSLLCRDREAQGREVHLMHCLLERFHFNDAAARL